MNAIIPVNETDDTVTLRRADWEALLDRMEDVADWEAIARSETQRARLGADEHRRLSYTAAEISRMLDDGIHPIRVWREREGLSARALAAAANLSPSYLAEIEGGQKP